MNATRREGSTGGAQERHGLYRCGAFRAARIRRPSLQYSRVELPPGPNSWPLNIPAACWVPRALRFLLEPIREVSIHDEELATRRLSMMRIMARWMKAATVLA